jgi:F0F1-type ATP synthase assembly protein I
MNRLVLIAEVALAGMLVGFLIGPESLDQFFGTTFRNTVAFNIIAGGVIGAILGFLATALSPAQTE